jgi:formylglycine-generating enzyme required for sulfatase activity
LGVFVDRKSRFLLVGVFCVSLAAGSLADSYTEVMEAAAALLESAKAALNTAIADCEVREGAVKAVHPVVVDTVTAKAVVVDSAAAVKAVAVDSAAVKPAVKPAAKPAVVVRPPKVYPIVKPEIEMVLVKGGKFKMGCVDDQESCVNDERPRHEVQLKDYYIGKYQVTQKQWWSVMGVNPSFREGENLPVEQVSWDDVQEFIKRLNVLTGKKYRLPTEAEWEYAARGGARGSGKKFSGNAYLYDVAWYGYNSFGLTQPVGAKEPNELGIYDMLGNVWEWVGDWYDRFYYRDSPLKNPVGPKYGTERVSRGCSFNSDEGHCRESLRNYNKPGSRTIYLGFRLVRQ